MGHDIEGARNHAIVRRIASLGAAMATVATLLFVVTTNAAAAGPVGQINIQGIVCPILLAIRAAIGDFGGFGAFIAQIFDRLLVGFGCATTSG